MDDVIYWMGDDAIRPYTYKQLWAVKLIIRQ